MKRIGYDVVFYTVLLMGYVIFALLMNRAYKEIDKQVIQCKISNFPTIILDAGHGGPDGGTSSSNGIKEKDINLKIAKILKDMFISSGFEVIMTREDDISIHDKNASTIREKKISDLKNRLKITEENPNGILISIHQNFLSQEKYKGAQMFYSKNNESSQMLAKCMKESFGLIDFKNKREVKSASNNIFLLSNVKIPAIIIECGFLSNKEEAALLSTFEYQQKLAFCIFSGYLDYSKSLSN